MQKQRFEPRIHFQEVYLSDHFPVDYFHHIQKHQDLSKLHYHGAFEIGLCIEGSGLFFIGQKTYTFKAGDVSFIYPNQPHIAQSPNEVPSQWYFITVDLFRLFQGNSQHLTNLIAPSKPIAPILSVESFPNIKELYQLIYNELEMRLTDYESSVTHLFCSLLINIHRQTAYKAPLKTYEGHEFEKIAPALNHLLWHYSDDLSIPELAHLCHLSDSQFRYLFKKVIQQTPFHYLTQIRMKMAHSLLLSTDLSVLTISENVGYTSLSSFNRSYLKAYGQPPSKCRKISLNGSLVQSSQ